jgi:hypothetical protein
MAATWIGFGLRGGNGPAGPHFDSRLGWMESPASRRLFSDVPIGWQSGPAMPGTFTARASLQS